MLRPYQISMASVILIMLISCLINQVAHAEPSDVYIVEFADKPVNKYSGGIEGYKSTKLTTMGKLSLNSPIVKQYQNYLIKLHDEALTKSGVPKRNKIYEYTFSFNGMAARLSTQQAEKMRTLTNVLNVHIDRKFNGS